MRLYKATEWQSGRNWYVGDCSDLGKDSNAWWIPPRFLGISLEDWIIKLQEEHHATIDGFYPKSNNRKSLLLYHWDNYNDAHKFCLYLNRMARNHNWTI